jgi:hypothetical protein
VTGYRLYWSPAETPVDYTSPNHDFVAADLPDDPNSPGKKILDLTGVDAMQTLDGTYNLGLTAIDDAGNESGMSVLSGIGLDFVAPAPPTDLEFIAE